MVEVHRLVIRNSMAIGKTCTAVLFNDALLLFVIQLSPKRDGHFL